MFKSVQFRIYNQPAHVGPMGHETRKVQTGEERDTWHMDPTTALGPLGSNVQCLTGGHKDTWHMDWTPPLGPLGDSGESLIDEHLWHYRDPCQPETYTTCEEWVPWESIRTLSYFVIHCLAMSYHKDRHTPVNEMKRWPQGEKKKKSTCFKRSTKDQIKTHILCINVLFQYGYTVTYHWTSTQDNIT